MRQLSEAGSAAPTGSTSRPSIRMVEAGEARLDCLLAGRDVSHLHLGIEAALAQDLVEQLARLVVDGQPSQ